MGSVAADGFAIGRRGRDDGTGRIGSCIQQHPGDGGSGRGVGRTWAGERPRGYRGGFFGVPSIELTALVAEGTGDDGRDLARALAEGGLDGRALGPPRGGPRPLELGRDHAQRTLVLQLGATPAGEGHRAWCERDGPCGDASTSAPRKAKRLMWQSATSGTEEGRVGRRVQMEAPACVETDPHTFEIFSFCRERDLRGR